MKASAAVAAILALTAAAHAAAEPRCTVPDILAQPLALLPRVAIAVKTERKLDIVVLSGAPSQVGRADGPRSYPFFLDAALRGKLQDVNVRVAIRSAPRRTAFELVPMIPQILAEEKPTLVVWQSGTVEAYRGVDPDLFGRKLELGVTTLLNGSSDVMLVNMQYSPRTDALVDAASYTDTMRSVADLKDVPFFNRYAIMHSWSESGAFDLAALHIGREEYEQIHRCLGELMAEFILRAAALSESASR
jgi:hypothetical protein